MTEIFIKLRKIREALGLKQSHIAKCTGMSQRDVSLLENGRKEFIPNAYIVFYTQLGIDTRWVFNGRSYDEDFGYLRDFVRQLTTRNMTGEDLINEYTRRVAAGMAPFDTGLMQGNEIYAIRTEGLREYVSRHDEPGYLERLERLQVPMLDAGRDKMRCFQIEDELMAPHILPGDYIIGRKTEPDEDILREGTPCIVISRDVDVGRVSFSGKNKLRLTFDNQQYPARLISLKEVRELWQVKWRLTQQTGGLSFGSLEELSRRLNELENKLGK